MFVCMALLLCKTLDNIATPSSVKTITGFLVQPQLDITDCDIKFLFKVTFCDLRLEVPIGYLKLFVLDISICNFQMSVSCLLSWNIKSAGNLSIFLFTA